MACPNCQTRNPERHKFCAQCGERLKTPAARPSSEDAEVARRLHEAFDALQRQDGNTALAAAQAALAMAPESATAHCALGLAYERLGKRAEAVRQFEIVSVLDPESSAEQDKLATLMGASPLAARRRLPRQPLWMVAAAAVATVGLAAVLVTVRLGDASRATPPVEAPTFSPAGPTINMPRGPSGAVSGVTPAAPPRVSSVAPRSAFAVPGFALDGPPQPSLALPPAVPAGVAAFGAAAPTTAIDPLPGMSAPPTSAESHVAREPAPPRRVETRASDGGGGTIQIATEKTAPRDDPGPANAAAATPRQPPNIKVELNQAPPANSGMQTARGHEAIAREALRRRNKLIAERELRQAERLYGQIASRGGSEGVIARERLLAVEEALADLRR